MKKSKAIRRLKEIRRDAEECLRDSIESNIEEQDIEALTAGIEALSAREPDRTGRLRRDSKMLEQILDAIKPKVCKDDRRIFAALVQYWQDGRKATTPVEIVALEEQRGTWEFKVATKGGFGTWDETVAKIALLLLADVHPETKKEVKTDDQQC